MPSSARDRVRYLCIMSRAAGKWADRCPARPGHSSPIAARTRRLPWSPPGFPFLPAALSRQDVARSSPQRRLGTSLTGSIRSDLAAAMTAINDVLATMSRVVSDDRSRLRQARVQAGQETMRPGAGVGADWTGYTHLARGGFGPAPGRRNADGLARLRSRSLAGTGWRFGASTWPPCRGPVRRQRSGRSCRCNEEGPWMVSC